MGFLKVWKKGREQDGVVAVELFFDEPHNTATVKFQIVSENVNQLIEEQAAFKHYQYSLRNGKCELTVSGIPEVIKALNALLRSYANTHNKQHLNKKTQDSLMLFLELLQEFQGLENQTPNQPIKHQQKNKSTNANSTTGVVAHTTTASHKKIQIPQKAEQKPTKTNNTPASIGKRLPTPNTALANTTASPVVHRKIEFTKDIKKLNPELYPKQSPYTFFANPSIPPCANNTIEDIHSQLSNLRNDICNPSPASPNEKTQLKILKYNVLQELIHYYESRQPKISSRRSKDIADINNIVKNAVNPDEFKRAISERTRQIKTGWLFRSKLRDYVRSALADEPPAKRMRRV